MAGIQSTESEVEVLEAGKPRMKLIYAGFQLTISIAAESTTWRYRQCSLRELCDLPPKKTGCMVV